MKRLRTRRRSRATVADVKRGIARVKASDVSVIGCSLCVRLVLKPGREPAPCPVCGAMVTATRAGGAK